MVFDAEAVIKRTSTLNQYLNGIQYGKAYNMIIAHPDNNAFISNIRIICWLRRVKVYVKNIGLGVIVKASSFYKICLGHLIFLLSSFPYLEIKKVVIINPSLLYSRYTTHRYFELLGAVLHQRKASNSPYFDVANQSISGIDKLYTKEGNMSRLRKRLGKVNFAATYGLIKKET